MVSRWCLGVDVGATGTKAGLVDLSTGKLVSERIRVDTPESADQIFITITQLVTKLRAVHPEARHCPVGVAFPSVIKGGTILTAANIDPATIGRNVEQELADVLNAPVVALNDADAAALAEVQFGLLAEHPEYAWAQSVMVLTLGTGIGSGYIYQGKLVPNFELGHLELDGAVAEHRAAASAIHREGLDWSDYAKRVNNYMAHVHRLFHPDIFIVGGGVSRQAEDFLVHLKSEVPVEVARLRADAGIIGAALFAQQGT